MRTFLISYDLAKPNRNRHALASAIMDLGQAWARPLEQTWYVRAEASEDDLSARLAALLDADDGLVVQAVRNTVALTNTSLRWFRPRRPAVDSDALANVIAFPTVKSAPAGLPALPLARAG